MSNKLLLKKKYIIPIIALILFLGGTISFNKLFKEDSSENLYLYGIVQIESGVRANAEYDELYKKSLGGSLNFGSIESLGKFLRLQENNIILVGGTKDITESIKIKNKRQFFKTFGDFYIEHFAQEMFGYKSYDESYSVVKIPIKFINFENDDKDYLELDYLEAQFISGETTKEECQKIINLKAYT